MSDKKMSATLGAHRYISANPSASFAPWRDVSSKSITPKRGGRKGRTGCGGRIFQGLSSAASGGRRVVDPESLPRIPNGAAIGRGSLSLTFFKLQPLFPDLLGLVSNDHTTKSIRPRLKALGLTQAKCPMVEPCRQAQGAQSHWRQERPQAELVRPVFTLLAHGRLRRLYFRGLIVTGAARNTQEFGSPFALGFSGVPSPRGGERGAGRLGSRDELLHQAPQAVVHGGYSC